MKLAKTDEACAILTRQQSEYWRRNEGVDYEEWCKRNKERMDLIRSKVSLSDAGVALYLLASGGEPGNGIELLWDLVTDATLTGNDMCAVLSGIVDAGVMLLGLAEARHEAPPPKERILQ